MGFEQQEEFVYNDTCCVCRKMPGDPAKPIHLVQLACSNTKQFKHVVCMQCFNEIKPTEIRKDVFQLQCPMCKKPIPGTRIKTTRVMTTRASAWCMIGLYTITIIIGALVGGFILAKGLEIINKYPPKGHDVKIIYVPPVFAMGAFFALISIMSWSIYKCSDNKEFICDTMHVPTPSDIETCLFTNDTRSKCK